MLSKLSFTSPDVGQTGGGDTLETGLDALVSVVKPSTNDTVTSAAQTLDPTVYPYDTVVRVTAQIGSQSWQGSGVLISPDEVLTASHVVYNSGIGSATSIDVAPAYENGAEPLGHMTGTLTHYFQIADNPSISPTDSQTDYAIIHLSSPLAGLGTMGMTSDFAGGTVHVTAYPASADGSMVDSLQAITVDPNYSLFDGPSLGEGSSGGPVWVYGSDGTPYIVGLVSSANDSMGYDTQITTSVFNQIEAWVHQDDSASSQPLLQIYDTTKGTALTDILSQIYTGPVSGLQEKFIDITSENLNITAKVPNYFIHTGSGNNAVTLLSGTNVVDAGTGSNFLTSGAGTDTLFVDSRSVVADTWSTFVGFHSGDATTLFGVTQAGAVLQWLDNDGAVGAKGLTLHAQLPNKPTVSLTLAGYSQADLSNGKLSVSFGSDGTDSAYFYVHAN